MDFGKILPHELDTADLSLPSDPDWNQQILTGQKVPNQKAFLGCAKWARTEWIGKIYPEGTKEAKFLEHYVQHYNSIELNATHYKIYSPQAIKKWAEKADGYDFLFCPKVPQSISHYSTFLNAEEQTTQFLEGITAFGKHLGPIFLQVSERFSPKRKDNLYKYLLDLPTDLQFFLEVRNAEWFADKKIVDELLNTLKEFHIGYVITDAAGRRDCVHMHLTVPKHLLDLWATAFILPILPV